MTASMGHYRVLLKSPDVLMIKIGFISLSTTHVIEEDGYFHYNNKYINIYKVQ